MSEQALTSAPPARRQRQHRRPTLRQYVRRRLGADSATMARNLVVKPLGARSFSAFWRYWNPVYSYFLYYYAYRPLRRVVPRLLALWLTFVVCGFLLHDALGWLLTRHIRFPEMTLIFTCFGAVAVLSELFAVDLSRAPFVVRAGSNLACLAGCWAAATALMRGLG